MRAVGGNLYHKPILPKLTHQRGIFAHGVKDDNAVIGGKKHIHKFPLSAEALAAPRNAEIFPDFLTYRSSFTASLTCSFCFGLAAICSTNCRS